MIRWLNGYRYTPLKSCVVSNVSDGDEKAEENIRLTLCLLLAHLLPHVGRNEIVPFPFARRSLAHRCLECPELRDTLQVLDGMGPIDDMGPGAPTGVFGCCLQTLPALGACYPMRVCEVANPCGSTLAIAVLFFPLEIHRDSTSQPTP